jgi:hypothetical protein
MMQVPLSLPAAPVSGNTLNVRNALVAPTTGCYASAFRCMRQPTRADTPLVSAEWVGVLIDDMAMRALPWTLELLQAYVQLTFKHSSREKGWDNPSPRCLAGPLPLAQVTRLWAALHKAHDPLVRPSATDVARATAAATDRQNHPFTASERAYSTVIAAYAFSPQHQPPKTTYWQDAVHALRQKVSLAFVRARLICCALCTACRWSEAAHTRLCKCDSAVCCVSKVPGLLLAVRFDDQRLW